MIGIFESSEYISSQFHGLCIQLNWPSETITQNKYITCRETQRATYDGSGTAYEKLSSRRTHWCGDPLFIFIFWQFFWRNRQKIPDTLESPHSWMHLVESSNTEVPGASEVPQSRDHYERTFLKILCSYYMWSVQKKVRMNNFLEITLNSQAQFIFTLCITHT